MPISDLMDGHRRFKNLFAHNKAAFTQLADEGQSPKVLWIGCSDSRVIPEQITGAKPGDLFVMRNVANVVPPFSLANDAVGAVIEYAVLHLQVSDIVICGHTDCGGIKALYDHPNMAREPHIARWMGLLRLARTHIEASGVPKEMQFIETIKANILVQRRNLYTYACVKERAKLGELSIHGWLYDLHTGDLFTHDEKLEQWRALISPDIIPSPKLNRKTLVAKH